MIVTTRGCAPNPFSLLLKETAMLLSTGFSQVLQKLDTTDDGMELLIVIESSLLL